MTNRSWVTASAPAKVNLFFGVGALKSNGYHDVVSIYQGLDLRETVAVTPAQEATKIVVSGSISEQQMESIPLGPSNLVIRASSAVCKVADLEDVALDYRIFKAVPVAGGMAGGSADAAASMVATNQLLELGLTTEALQKQALQVGADVPFSIMGGTAIGRGRGEILQKLELGAQLHFVMVLNEHGLSTPEVYAELDRLREAEEQDIQNLAEPETPSELIDALAQGNLKSIADLIHNDLEPAALSLLPELELTIAAAQKYGALRAFVSGSGPTVAALVANAEDAEALALALSHANLYAFPVSSSPLGAHLEPEE